MCRCRGDAADEASLTQDTDNDGIVNFDETNRFKTLPNKTDTDSDCVLDKQDIRGYVFDNLGNYSPRRADWDFDGLRKELDRDNDGGGSIDGVEDANLNGKTVDRFGRRDGGETSNFFSRDDRPGDCGKTPTPTPRSTPPPPTWTPTPKYAHPPIPPHRPGSSARQRRHRAGRRRPHTPPR